MLLNSPSLIIKELILPGIDDILETSFGSSSTAISPIVPFDGDPGSLKPLGRLCIHSISRIFPITICTNSLSDSENAILHDHLSKHLLETRTIMSILLQKNHTAELHSIDRPSREALAPGVNDKYFRIDIGIGEASGDRTITLILTESLLRLFSKKKAGQDELEIELELIRYFKNPLHLLPRFHILLESLSKQELQRLFYLLLMKRQLTAYQLMLLTLAYPEKSLSFKHNLPSAMIRDVVSMKRNLAGTKIDKRDLAGGVYSVEESIYMQMKSSSDFSYSKFLIELQKIVMMMQFMDLLDVKDFPAWIAEMAEKKLLHQAVSMTRDEDISLAISDSPTAYAGFLSEVLPPARVNEILSHCDSIKASSYDRLRARSSLISAFRKILIQRRRFTHQSFEFLLMSMERPEDYNRLLLEVGWFALSTACKELKKKVLSKAIDCFYAPARYLIEDVLSGVVNPNIIHDEMQVNKARMFSVNAILSLYESGAIALAI